MAEPARPLARKPVSRVAAGSSVAGSSRLQALIQRRQRLTDELQRSTLVILSQPAPGESAMALYPSFRT